MSPNHDHRDHTPLGQRLAAAVTRLATILEQEVSLLEGAKATQLADLVPEKRAATQDYRALLLDLSNQSGGLADLDAGRRGELEALARRLAAATEANVRALKAGLEANARLVRTIARAVEAVHAPGESYRPDGRLGAVGAPGAPAAVSFNQVL